MTAAHAAATAAAAVAAAAAADALDEALERLLGAVAPLGARRGETVSTFDALGRVLAADVRSALDVPPADNSAMDGYAVRAADVAAPARVLPVDAAHRRRQRSARRSRRAARRASSPARRCRRAPTRS